MKKFFLQILVLLALPLCTIAQTATSSARRLSLVVAPNISYLATQSDLGDQQPRVGFHTRFDAEFRLQNRLWLRVGAGWTLMRYEIKLGNILQWPSQNNGNGGFDPNQPGEDFGKVLAEDKMLTFPVALRYFMGKNQRFYADIESGASLILLETGGDKLRPNVGLALGWQGHVGAQTWLFVQPAFRYIFNNSFSGNLRKHNQHPYGFGLELGLRKGL